MTETVEKTERVVVNVNLPNSSEMAHYETVRLAIGISGYAGSGKDTVALMLQKMLEQRSQMLWPIRHFADPLKEGCMAILGLTKEQCRDPVLKAEVDAFWQKTPREILQYVGTELFREHFDQDVWTKTPTGPLGYFRKYGAVLAPDTRFPNEAKAIQDVGGVVVKVIRPGISAPKGGISNHASETSVDLIEADFDVINDGTLEDLRHSVSCLMSLITRFYQSRR